MNREILKRLYYQSTCAVPCEGKRIDELYEPIPETQVAWPHISDILDRFVNAEEKDIILGELVYTMDAFEQQGYINGLRMGAMLMNEIGIAPPPTFPCPPHSPEGGPTPTSCPAP